MELTIQEQIAQLQQAINQLSQNPPDHYHNGFDSSQIPFGNIAQKRLWIHHTIQGTNAATAANYDTFWISPIAGYVNSFKEVHSVLGTDGGTVTVMLEKITGTTAPGSGVSVLSTALSLKSAINTVVSGTITGTIANKNLAIGDRLALKKAGTLTSVANVSVLVEIIIV